MLLLLTLLMSEDANVARLISTLARVRGVSASRLAADCAVQKSALLRFCKRQSGGYLSEEARERVLGRLGWKGAGLSQSEVHTWKISDLSDAQFLFEEVLQRRAAVSFLRSEGSSHVRIAVGVAGDAPLVVSATYEVPSEATDPMVSGTIGPYPPAKGIFVDPGVLDSLVHSPKSFFKVLRARDVSASGPVPTSLADGSPLKQLSELGFAKYEVEALIEDFLTMQCRLDPQAMRERLKKIYGAQAVSSGTPDKRAQTVTSDRDVDGRLAKMAAREYTYSWVSMPVNP